MVILNHRDCWLTVSQAEEYAISEHVLKILRASVPHMPKTAVKFGQDLQATLQPMVIKPNMRNLNTLQETIACICAVVKHLTHDYGRLVNLLKSCHSKRHSTTQDSYTDWL